MLGSYDAEVDAARLPNVTNPLEATYQKSK
jgi:hypothetical protein